MTDSDEVFGLSRMTQSLRQESPPEIQVFRELAPAREWLGLPLEHENFPDDDWVGI